ncbi:hypothetical protein Q5P01_004886 [Channa striata]|uniref:XK-related protein n=1 Tax=Channa striata TaxID=64152 RepID=A0AA88T2I8_CHASR|nr:hypothetical protein Q5P01_004886 [Channa striata]
MNAAGAVARARRMPPSAAAARRSSGCWIAWCQAVLLGASALVIVAERSALIYCIGFYLWNEETQWAGLTLGLFLPGTAVQLLSAKWFYDDGMTGDATSLSYTSCTWASSKGYGTA